MAAAHLLVVDIRDVRCIGWSGKVDGCYCRGRGGACAGGRWECNGCCWSISGGRGFVGWNDEVEGRRKDWVGRTLEEGELVGSRNDVDWNGDCPVICAWR